MLYPFSIDGIIDEELVQMYKKMVAFFEEKHPEFNISVFKSAIISLGINSMYIELMQSNNKDFLDAFLEKMRSSGEF